MSGPVELPASNFLAHFPYDAGLGWPGVGTLQIFQDQPTSASTLPAGNPQVVSYARDCQSIEPLGCGTIGRMLHLLDPTSPLAVTGDGGFWAQGNTTTIGGTRRDVQISYLDALSGGGDVFTHDTSTFTSGHLFMAGHTYEVPFGDNPTLAPAILLNSGYQPADGGNPAEMHRPGTQDYEDGFADYPGINYRVTNQTAIATLGGNTTAAFDLRNRSKYYLRYGGTSGIHEAEPGDFPATVNISSYLFDISHFGLSFLDSEVHDSTTTGSVYFPDPCDVTFAFDGLRFDCLGLPDDTAPAPGSAVEDLAYWDSDIVMQGLDFQTAVGSDCDPGGAKAVLAVRAFASNIEDPLHGLLGIQPGGTLITGGDEILEGIDSRLVLPNTVFIDGPREERYGVHRAAPCLVKQVDRFPRDGPRRVGTLNLAGLLDVPFFRRPRGTHANWHPFEGQHHRRHPHDGRLDRGRQHAV